MIQIEETMVSISSQWSVDCPFCKGDISFYVSAAMYCPRCSKPIPPLHLLVDEDPDFAIETRLEYYKKGWAWINGDY